jgi:hypothetical protein
MMFPDKKGLPNLRQEPEKFVRLVNLTLVD